MAQSAKYTLAIALVLLAVSAYGIGFIVFTKHVENIQRENGTALQESLRADAIIVLTGGSNRVNSGFELYKNDAAKYLFISGINADVSPQKVMDSAGVDIARKKLECCVKFGSNAEDTRGNAVEAKQWIESKEDIKRLLLVTSDYHMHRALMEFRHFLPDKTIYPYAVKSSLEKAGIGQYAKVTFIEYNKLLISWIKNIF